MNIENKNVLFIATKYFDYYKEIEKSIQAMGARTFTFIDNPYDKYHIKFLYYKIGQRFVPYVVKKYQSFILRKIKDISIDYVFVVKGEDILTHDFLRKLKLKYPNAVFILYQWDSVKNFNYLDYISYFDRVYSFDTQDCKDYNLSYVPLFALNEFYKAAEIPLSKRNLDVTLLASYQDHRLKSGKVIDAICRQQGKKYLFKLHTPFTWFMFHNLIKYKMAFVKKMLNWSQNYPGITFISVDKKEWQEILARTKIVVDLSHPLQTGLTMRTFEALASGCHLLTTNKNIRFESFYSPGCITICDRDNLVIPREINDCMIDFKPYSIDAWVERLFQM